MNSEQEMNMDDEQHIDEGVKNNNQKSDLEKGNSQEIDKEPRTQTFQKKMEEAITEALTEFSEAPLTITAKKDLEPIKEDMKIVAGIITEIRKALISKNSPKTSTPLGNKLSKTLDKILDIANSNVATEKEAKQVNDCLKSSLSKLNSYISSLESAKKRTEEVDEFKFE